MKKLMVFVLIFTLLLSETGCSKKSKEPEIEPDEFWVDINEVEEIEDDLQQTLFEDYENGVLSGDEVVSTTLSDLFDNEKSSECNLDALVNFVDEHWDELSIETQADYYEKLYLGGIDFEYGDSKTLFQKIVDPLFEDVYADETITNTLNYVITSEDSHFLVWYTTSGHNAITHEKAKEIAESLEDSIKAYDKLYGVTYEYNVTQKVSGSLLGKQRTMMKKAGLDEKLLEQAMSVYIYDNKINDNVLAYYSQNSKDVSIIFDLLASQLDAVPEGIAITPFIVIKPSSLKNKVNCDQLVNHEMFHHYQAQVFKDVTDKSKMQSLAAEATANMSSALITENKNTTNATLNDWVSKYSAYTANWKTYQRATTEVKSGYLLYPTLFNYSTYVPNGLDKIVKCLYKGNFFGALQQETNIAYRNKMMRMLMLHTLNNNYENKNLTNNYKYKIPYTYLKKDAKGNYQSVSDSLDPMGIRYYRIIKANNSNMDFVFDSIGENIDAVLVAKANGRYQIIQSLTRSIGKLSTVGFDDLNEFFVVCFDIAFAEDNVVNDTYSFTTTITSAKATEIPLETPIDGYSDSIIVEKDEPVISKPVIDIKDEENIIEGNQMVLDNETIKVSAKKLQIKDGMPLLYTEITNKTNGDIKISSASYTLNDVDNYTTRCSLYDENGKELTNSGVKIAKGSSEVAVLAISVKINTDSNASDVLSALEAYNIGVLAKLGISTRILTDTNVVNAYFEVKTKYFDSFDFNKSILHDYLESPYALTEKKYKTLYLNNDVNTQVGNIWVLGDAVVEKEDGSLMVMADIVISGNDEARWEMELTKINGINYEDAAVCSGYRQKPENRSSYHEITYMELDEICDEQVRKHYGLVQIGNVTYNVKCNGEETSFTISWAQEVNDLNGKVIYNGNDVTVLLLGISERYNELCKEFDGSETQFYFVAISNSNTLVRVEIFGEDNTGTSLVPGTVISAGEIRYFGANISTPYDQFVQADVCISTECIEMMNTYKCIEHVILAKD